MAGILEKLQGIGDGLKAGLRNKGMVTESIQGTGGELVPAIVKKLGCIAPVFTTVAGTASLIKGAIMTQNFENGFVYLATGLGLIFFSLMYPARKIFKK